MQGTLSPATHDSISFRSFLRTRTKEELQDLSFNKYIDPIIFVLSFDLEKKWLYLDDSNDGCMLVFRCNYCATCPFYLEFSKNDKGFFLIQFFDHDHSINNNMEWINFDSSKEVEMIKRKRYQQFNSDLKHAEAFYNEEMKKNPNDPFICKDCEYRLSLIKQMYCSENNYCDYCAHPRTSSIYPLDQSDLQYVLKSHRYCILIKDYESHKSYRLFNNYHVDVDEFYLGDLNNIFLWPIQRDSFRNTKTSLIPSLSSFHNHITNLCSSCSNTNHSMENPIITYHTQWINRDFPFFKERSIISDYIQNVEKLKEFLSPHSSILEAIGSLYLCPVLPRFSYSLSSPQCYWKMKPGYWLFQNHYESFKRNYQHCSSHHSLIHSIIEEQLHKAIEYSTIQDCLKEIDSIFHGVYCNQDIIIDTSISIVSSLFINEFMFTDHILYAGSLMTSQYNMILILLFCDYNHHYQPIAIRVCQEETLEEWKSLIQYTLSQGLSKINDLVILYDGNMIINEAFTSCIPTVSLHDCSFSIITFLLQVCDKPNIELNETEKNCLFACAVSSYLATTEEEYQACLETLTSIQPEIAAIIDRVLQDHILPSSVSNQFTLYPLYLAFSDLPLPPESNNDKNMNTICLIRTLLYWLIDQSDFRRQSLKLYITNTAYCSQFTTSYCPFVLEQVILQGACYEIQKERFKCDQNVVNDLELNLSFVCDFENRTCSCCLPQRMGYPCVHMIAILHSEKKYDQVVNYISDCYTKSEIVKNCPKIEVKKTKPDCRYKMIPQMLDSKSFTLFSDLYNYLCLNQDTTTYLKSHWQTKSLFPAESYESTSFHDRWEEIQRLLKFCVCFKKYSQYPR